MDEFETVVQEGPDDSPNAITLQLSTKDLPGIWLGITTERDLVALTNYRETMEYMAQSRTRQVVAWQGLWGIFDPSGHYCHCQLHHDDFLLFAYILVFGFREMVPETGSRLGR